ncbi:hypothetical protein BT96DRAFT_997045 [Gymnopus androsaceus JB14]|uniref:Uncharacterized protein n=1 Tax=Gymnopus androsaceus JB14 TaxID=1447944 RepID=A0A6A4HEK4_9AGAR|nr:hypothetical protein BT96DRAFT_997045 [Gymnopus androsaceus JB14]
MSISGTEATRAVRKVQIRYPSPLKLALCPPDPTSARPQHTRPAPTPAPDDTASLEEKKNNK